MLQLNQRKIPAMDKPLSATTTPTATTEKAEHAIAKFISSTDPAYDNPGPKALVVSGKWGVGKTFLWKTTTRRLALQSLTELGRWRWLANSYTVQFLTRYNKSKSFAKRNYAYVSLFGINSLDDLKLETSIGSVSFTELGDENSSNPNFPLRKKVWRWLSKGRSFWKFARLAANGVSVPLLSSPSKILSAIAAMRTRDALVCFDDLERRGEGLKLRDLLGYVCYLCDQRSCRVVVICNEDSLKGDDLEVWQNNKEKVFSHNVEFRPQPNEQCLLVFPENPNNPEWYSTAKRSLVKLNLSNLRIIQRTRMLLDEIFSGEREIFSADAERHVARSLVWFVYCYLGRAEGAPRLGHVSGHLSHVLNFNRQADNRTPEQRQHDEITYKFGHSHVEGIDDNLLDLVTNGFLDKQDLLESASKFDRDSVARNHRERFDSIWDRFSENFSDDSDQVLGVVLETFPKVVGTLSASDMDNIVFILRLINQDEQANSAISSWMEHLRADGKFPRLITGQAINDSILLDAVETALKVQPKLTTIAQAMRCLATDTGDVNLAVQTIGQTGADDLAKYLSSTPGKETRSAVNCLLRLPEQPNNPVFAAASSSIRSALHTLAESSPVMSKKIRHLYGEHLDGAS